MKFLDVLFTKQNFLSLLHQLNVGTFQFRRKLSKSVSDVEEYLVKKKEKRLKLKQGGHALHQPCDVAITIRMRAVGSPRPSGCHGQLLRTS